MTTPSPSSGGGGSGRWDADQLAGLLEQLHRANEHFSTVRQHVESLLNCADFDPPDHDAVENELRAANRELTDVTAKIHNLLSRRD